MSGILKYCGSVMKWHDKLDQIIEELDNEDIDPKAMKRKQIQVDAIKAHAQLLDQQLEYEKLSNGAKLPVVFVSSIKLFLFSRNGRLSVCLQNWHQSTEEFEEWFQPILQEPNVFAHGQGTTDGLMRWIAFRAWEEMERRSIRKVVKLQAPLFEQTADRAHQSILEAGLHLQTVLEARYELCQTSKIPNPN